MDRPGTIGLLRLAHDEIVTLRRQVADLAPRAHAYDTVAIIARLSQHEEREGFAEDVAWRLKEAVEHLVSERDAERAQTDQAAS